MRRRRTAVRGLGPGAAGGPVAGRGGGRRRRRRDNGIANNKDGVPTDSVVKVLVSVRSPDPLHPWTKQSPREASGTGVVIEGKRILTNAHVVTYASQIFVETSESGDKHVATVESIGPGIDLAVLKLEDESFFDKRPPIPRVHDLPAVKDARARLRLPAGGGEPVGHQGDRLADRVRPLRRRTPPGLRVQVDAAINPGNSGGPALIDGKVVGLIFSKLNQADNIGYIIPSEEIDLFLDDVKDGTYDGKPRLYDHFQTLENDALRAKLGLDRKATGLVVHAPDRDDADYPLKEWDLITKVGDHDVDNTGMVRVNGDLRLPAAVPGPEAHPQRHGAADPGPRRARRSRSTCRSSPAATMLIESLRGRYPSYFVYGPLAFSPVTAEFLAGVERGGQPFYRAPERHGQPAGHPPRRPAVVPGRGARRRRRADVPAPDRQGVFEPVHPGRQGGQRGHASRTSATSSSCSATARTSSPRSASTRRAPRPSSSTARRPSPRPRTSSTTTASARRQRRPHGRLERRRAVGFQFEE